METAKIYVNWCQKRVTNCMHNLVFQNLKAI